MGDPINDKLCEYNNVCFTTEATPKYLTLRVDGWIKPPYPWYIGGNPNGSYFLEQVSNEEWYKVGVNFIAAVRWNPYLTAAVLYYGVPGFIYSDGPACAAGGPGWMDDEGYYGGGCTISWVGGLLTEGNNMNLAATLSLTELRKIQHETWLTVDNLRRIRFARKRDHSCVHIKTYNEVK